MTYKEMSDLYKKGGTVAAKDIPLEKEFQKRIKKYLETLPKCCVWKVNQGVYSSSGIPDINCVIRGKFFAFEVKRPWIGRPTKLQKIMIEKINASGGHAAFVSFVYEVEEILKKAGAI